ncbi:MAG: exodeoxyribonuclease III [Methanomassiliicoccales archaeon]|jgi:exodeoxyribonuclease-3|nr:exodeoxyribonuclease III [Methanomassiliicoccales archaeon]
MRLVCWNVNGLRAAHRKGFLDFMGRDGADVLCVQEAKARIEDLPQELVRPPGYRFYLASPERDEDRGWSGVGLYTKKRPRKVEYGLGEDEFDGEGRAILAHYPDFVLMNIYFPNGKASRERLDFKLGFYAAFLRKAQSLMAEGRQLVVCGDVNTAHKEIDLARPRENSKVSGFLPQEREWLDRFVGAGLIDTFREVDPSPGRYSWWDIKTRARERNVGWRIDYFYITAGLRPRLKDAFILDQVQGSDHCPVGIVLS